MPHLHQTKLPDDTCSYWERQQFRDANERGFGASPYEGMSEEKLQKIHEKQEAEDEKDPPCGKCEICKESEKSSHDFPSVEGSALSKFQDLMDVIAEKLDAAGDKELADHADALTEQVTKLSTIAEMISHEIKSIGAVPGKPDLTHGSIAKIPVDRVVGSMHMDQIIEHAQRAGRKYGVLVSTEDKRPVQNSFSLIVQKTDSVVEAETTTASDERRWYCPQCKEPEVREGYLKWRDCDACGWQERLPTSLEMVEEERTEETASLADDSAQIKKIADRLIDSFQMFKVPHAPIMDVLAEAYELGKKASGLAKDSASLKKLADQTVDKLQLFSASQPKVLNALAEAYEIGKKANQAKASVVEAVPKSDAEHLRKAEKLIDEARSILFKIQDSNGDRIRTIRGHLTRCSSDLASLASDLEKDDSEASASTKITAGPTSDPRYKSLMSAFDNFLSGDSAFYRAFVKFIKDNAEEISEQVMYDTDVIAAVEKEISGLITSGEKNLDKMSDDPKLVADFIRSVRQVASNVVFELIDNETLKFRFKSNHASVKALKDSVGDAFRDSGLDQKIEDVLESHGRSKK